MPISDISLESEIFIQKPISQQESVQMPQLEYVNDDGVTFMRVE